MSEYELRLVTSGGALDEYLPDFVEAVVGPAFSDVGSISLDYKVSGLNYAALAAEEREVALTRNGVEVPDGRFVLQDDDGDELDENSPTRKFTGRTAVWAYLQDGLVYSPDGSTTVAKQTTFATATVGTVIRTLLQRAQTRGTSTLIDYSSFSNTLDSNGAAFTKVINIAYDPGVSILQVLQNLVDQGMCEVKTVGRSLYLYNPDTLSTDRTVQAEPLILRAGRDFKDAPRRRSSREVANVILIRGDNDVLQERTDATSLAARRRREQFVSQGGVSDSGTLNVIADTHLALKADPRVQRTFGVALTSESPRPFSDYFNGDFVFCDMGAGNERLRVRQISLTLKASGEDPDLALVLNDRIQEQEIALARKVQGITGGAALGGGSTAVAAPTTTDRLAPAAPAAPAVSSAAYVNTDGVTLAQATISWAAVTTNSDGTAISDLGGYEVQYARVSGQWIPLGRVDASTTVAYASGIPTGITVYARVRAYDTNGNSGAWSSVGSAVTAGDATPPPVPSAPVLSTPFFGAVTVDWDGLGSVGEAMPADFARLEIHMSTVNDFTPSAATQVDELTTIGGRTTIQAPANILQYIKFISVDQTGNKSAASAQASATPSQAVSQDLIDGIITATKVGFAIGGGNLVPNSSYEDTTQNPSGGSASIEITYDTTNPARGTRCLAVRRVDGGDSYYFHPGMDGRVMKGKRVIVSWDWRREGATGAVDLPSLQDDGYTQYVTVTVTSTVTQPGTTWARSYGYVDVPNAGTDGWHLVMRPIVAAAANYTDHVYYDGLQVEIGDVVTAYAPKPDEILAGQVTATELAAGAVTAAKTTLAAIDPTSGSLTINSVATNNLVAGAVTTLKLASGAVTTEKLTVASTGDNALLNGDFEEAAAADATLPAQWERGAWPASYGESNLAVLQNSPVLSGSRSLELQITSAVNNCSAGSTPQMPVVAGEQWYVAGWVKASAALAGGLYMRLKDQANTEIYCSTLENEPVTTGWTKVEGVFTIPSGMTTARFFAILYGPDAGSACTLWIDNVTMKKVTVSVQIADGAVKADKIDALAVVAGKIATDAVSTNELAANSITAAKGQLADLAVVTAKIGSLAVTDAKIADLSVGKLTAGTLAADVTVSARIKTANAGARVELNSSGLQAFDSSGTQTVAISSADGSVTLTGTLRTAFSGQRVEIGTGVANTIQFYSGNANEYQYGKILTGSDGFMSITPPLLSTGTGWTPYITMGFNSGATAGSSLSAGAEYVSIFADTSMEIYRGAGSTTPMLTLKTNTASSQGPILELTQYGVSPTASWVFWVDMTGSYAGSDARLWLECATGSTGTKEMHFGPRAGSTYLNAFDIRTQTMYLSGYASTTASAANMFVSATTPWGVARSTSSLKYKHSIREIVDPEWSILEMVPFRYKSKATAESVHHETGEPMHSRDFIGLAAEDADMLGLHELCTYDENGEPDWLMYERLVPLMLPILKNYRDRIEALERRKVIA